PRIWDAPSGKLRHELRGHAEMTPHHFPSMLHACAVAPDGKHVATADKVGRIIVWDAQSGAKVSEMEAPVMYTWDPVQRRHSIGGHGRVISYAMKSQPAFHSCLMTRTGRGVTTALRSGRLMVHPTGPPDAGPETQRRSSREHRSSRPGGDEEFRPRVRRHLRPA